MTLLSLPSVVTSVGRLVVSRLLHTGTAVATDAPRITTHYSVVPRENDPRWQGIINMVVILYTL